MSFIEISEWAVECDVLHCEGRLTFPDEPEDTEVRLMVPVIGMGTLALMVERGWLVAPGRMVCPECANVEGTQILDALATELQSTGGARDER